MKSATTEDQQFEKTAGRNTQLFSVPCSQYDDQLVVVQRQLFGSSFGLGIPVHTKAVVNDFGFTRSRKGNSEFQSKGQ